MSAMRIGRLLLTLGVLVGAAAGVGLLLGFEPARLPPALLNLAAYKLTFLAALAILAAGASLVRYGRQRAGSARLAVARSAVAQVGRGELANGGASRERPAAGTSQADRERRAAKSTRPRVVGDGSESEPPRAGP